MPDIDPLVRIRDLRYRYPGADHDVLRIPFLDVNGAGLIAITGPSGAGKSTLIEILAGTLRGDYSGSVQVLGQEWSDLHRDAERQRHLRRIGFIPQDYGLLTDRSVTALLSQDLRDSGADPSEYRERIGGALREVGLEGFGDRQVAALSGGQRQRVAIARMLARDVELVIADEPTANLDPALAQETLALFRRLADRSPVLIITHDPAVAAACDRTIVLQSAVADVEPPTSASPIRPGRRRRTRWLAAAVVLGVIGGASFAIVDAESGKTLVEQGASATNATVPGSLPVPTSTTAGIHSSRANGHTRSTPATTTPPTTTPPTTTPPTTTPPATTTPTATPPAAISAPTTIPPPVPGTLPCGPAVTGSGIEPTNIDIGCADAGVQITNLSWTIWSATGTAGGVGTETTGGCFNCGPGTSLQVNVQLSNPGYVNGAYVFQTITITPLSGPNAFQSGSPVSDPGSAWGFA